MVVISPEAESEVAEEESSGIAVAIPEVVVISPETGAVETEEAGQSEVEVSVPIVEVIPVN